MSEGVPSFIMGMLGKEMYESHSRLLREVAAAYGHDPEELIRRFLPAGPQLRIAPAGAAGAPTQGRVRVIVDAAPRPPPPAEGERCMARTWNRGKGAQCSRRRAEGSEYCAQHADAAAKGALRHGRIDAKPPKEVFGNADNRGIHTVIS